MSHQTGIQSDDKLKEIFCECTTQGNIRCVQVAIDGETLVCQTCVDKTSDIWSDEYDDVVLSLLKDKQPSYLIFQLGSKSEWLLITYSPDDSPVRQKMLYAATRATLKSEFGGGFVVEELFGNHKNDVSYSGYKEFLTHKNAPPPLTSAEEEIKFLDETEAKSAIGGSTRHKTVQGIEFPITSEAQSAIQSFKDGVVNHLELNVNTEKEEIFLTSASLITASDLESFISKERAGYHVFNYAHRHKGEDISSVVFIYSMPGYSIPVKSRMLYSSCKAPLLDTLEDVFKITIDRKVECDSSEAVSEEFLRDTVHPAEIDKKQNFEKPKAPGRRAPTRRPRRIEANDQE